MSNELSIPYRTKQDCCGCSACVDICPVNAITMLPDSEGFLYPNVEKRLCISCGKCVKVCGFQNVKPEQRFPRVYGMKHRDHSVRMSSRSGAAFIGFSDEILKGNGVVYGAVLQKVFSVKHCRATSFDERDQMKKAKYVQSDTRNTFTQVEIDLSKGYKVLFSGTPCQIAGLQSYLSAKKADCSNLICCDIICFGVPSPMIWSSYLQMIEKRHKQKIIEAEFRDKDFGWSSHFESFRMAGRKKKIVSHDYADLFTEGIMLRPSCHNCPFTSIHRTSDLTLGDFWGIEKINDTFNDECGVSLVFVNSEAGAHLFEKVNNQFEYFECSSDNVMQRRLSSPTTPSPRRNQFWKDYHEMPFDALLRKYTKPAAFTGKVRKIIKTVLYRLGIRNYP